MISVCIYAIDHDISSICIIRVSLENVSGCCFFSLFIPRSATQNAVNIHTNINENYALNSFLKWPNWQKTRFEANFFLVRFDKYIYYVCITNSVKIIEKNVTLNEKKEITRFIMFVPLTFMKNEGFFRYLLRYGVVKDASMHEKFIMNISLGWLQNNNHNTKR